LDVFTGSATNLSALVTIDDGYDTLSDAIANIDEHAEQMQGNPWANCTGTNIAAGLDSAFAQFTNGEESNPAIGRAIVL